LRARGSHPAELVPVGVALLLGGGHSVAPARCGVLQFSGWRGRRATERASGPAAGRGGRCLHARDRALQEARASPPPAAPALGVLCDDAIHHGAESDHAQGDGDHDGVGLHRAPAVELAATRWPGRGVAGQRLAPEPAALRGRSPQRGRRSSAGSCRPWSPPSLQLSGARAGRGICGAVWLTACGGLRAVQVSGRFGCVQAGRTAQLQ
jgi:hypothetical protein